MMTSTLDQAAQLEVAKKELTKLPILGPAMWLFARDPQRRFTFVADLDWRLMPPLVLEQCKLFSKAEIPWAFVTWAFVNDAVDQRLRSASPIIAPHEWKGGDKAWLIDVVAPFGEQELIAQQAVQELGIKTSVSAWLQGPAGQPSLKEFPARG
jgi:cytolysin-activating lysine-acyltransferase